MSAIDRLRSFAEARERGGYAHVARHERGANLTINCKDGTHIDVRPAERKV